MPIKILGLADEGGSANRVKRLQYVTCHIQANWLHHAQWLLLFKGLCSKPDSYQAASGNYKTINSPVMTLDSATETHDFDCKLFSCW